MEIQGLSQTELMEIGGGDWFETTAGIMFGTAFAAGFLGSGGLLGIAAAAGAALVMEDYL